MKRNERKRTVGIAGRARRAVHLQSRRRQLYRRRTGGWPNSVPFTKAAYHQSR